MNDKFAPANRYLLSFLIAFCYVASGGMVCDHQIASAQEYAAYEIQDWNPLREDWDYENLTVLDGPESGIFYRDENGDFVYENTDDTMESDQLRVMLTSHNLLSEVNVLIDKTTSVISYQFVGEIYDSNPTGNGDPDGDPENDSGNLGDIPVGSRVTLYADPEKGNVVGEVVGLPGSNAPIPDGETIHVFVTDKSVAFDAWAIWWDIDGAAVFHKDIANWQGVADGFDGVDENSVDVVVISGHRAGGGVHSSDGGLVPWRLESEQVKAIQHGTSEDTVIVICACRLGAGQITTLRVQELADLLDRTIIVNDGPVSSGTNGAGHWLKIDPRDPDAMNDR